jgi:hypothetical protein
LARRPLQHEILTGTNEDGTKNADACRDWTVGSADAKAMLGHADRPGPQPRLELMDPDSPVAGLRLRALPPIGGASLLYCFATN